MYLSRIRAQSLQECDKDFTLVAQKITLHDSQQQMRKSRLVTHENNRLLFYAGAGNNSELVKRVMEGRPQWRGTDVEDRLIHFRWKLNDRMFKYESLLNPDGAFQIVNHIQCHRQLSEKCNLIRNLQRFCYANKMPLWEITPVSFVIDLKNVYESERGMKEFKQFFERHDPQKKMKKKLSQTFSQIIKENKYIKPKMHPSFQSDDGNYVWILKPSELNRGRGIQFFRTLEELKVLINQLQYGTTDYKFENKFATQIKSKEFVIQKYIQRPFLIEGRKFDIRTWVLITHELDVYVFEQGYLRLSSEIFNLSNLDSFIHLTNNAVQKHSAKYSLFEQGNQMSYDQFDQLTGGEFSQQALPKMKQMIAITFMSIKKSISRSRYAFEIFGYDFMIDQQLKPWLIEVNTNPCLDESSPLLKHLLPKMLDDAFQLVLDVHFSKKPKANNQWEHLFQLF